MDRARAVVDAVVAGGDAAPAVYGVNTGFGALAEVRISAAEVTRLQQNLVRSHAAGVGAPLPRESVRVYVIDNKEWNAFAMGNYSIYVFTGLLKDMDNDEVAIVLGHELVHATHEHSRRQFKKDMWVQLAMLGALGAASTIDSDTQQAVAGLAVLAAGSALKNGYGRGMEDQADRVGLRYAYEAGYDIQEPVPYSPEYRNNHYKCMIRIYGVNEPERTGAHKLMWGLCPSGAPGYDECGCASFFHEDYSGVGSVWDGSPVRFRVEWRGGVTRLFRNGSEELAISESAKACSSTSPMPPWLLSFAGVDIQRPSAGGSTIRMSVTTLCRPFRSSLMSPSSDPTATSDELPTRQTASMLVSGKSAARRGVADLSPLHQKRAESTFSRG